MASVGSHSSPDVGLSAGGGYPCPSRVGGSGTPTLVGTWAAHMLCSPSLELLQACSLHQKAGRPWLVGQSAKDLGIGLDRCLQSAYNYNCTHLQVWTKYTEN